MYFAFSRCSLLYLDYFEFQTGKTLLISATVRGRHSTLDYLLQQPGIDINARESSGDWGGTAFHFACYYHKKTIAEKLISAGCNTILQDKVLSNLGL